MRRALLSVLPVVAAALALAPTSCAPSGFADPTQIKTVRILASTASEPYARPGDDVTVNVLAYDGRSSQPEPMTVYWLPFVCENPTNDAYYACFQQLEGGKPGGGVSADAGVVRDGGASADAGAGGGDGGTGTGSFIGPGGVITAPTGPSYTFRVPSDAITSHTPTPGSTTPYGLTILFNVACAGHLELVPVDPNDQNPQTVPIGCFDASHHQLGPDDWVFGFTRVYAYDKLTNANPVISYIDVGGKHLAVTPQAGAPQTYTTPACNSGTGCLSMPHCTGDASSCQVKIGPVVPSTSWEVNPAENDVNGKPLHEEIWVDYYATFGSLDDESRLLYDATSGSVLGSSPTTPNPSATDNTFTAPSSAGTGTIWTIVHDSRGGAAWVTIPVLVQ